MPGCFNCNERFYIDILNPCPRTCHLCNTETCPQCGGRISNVVEEICSREDDEDMLLAGGGCIECYWIHCGMCT